MTTTEGKPTMSVKEVSEYLNLSEATVYNYMYQKIIPARQVGRKWLISRAVIERFLNEPRQ